MDSQHPIFPYNFLGRDYIYNFELLTNVSYVIKYFLIIISVLLLKYIQSFKNS